jgi:hypothetical protein
MTYFAFDGPSPTVSQQLGDEVGRLARSHSQQPVHVYALIDGAFDEAFFTKDFKSRSLRVSLYAGTTLSGFEDASLFLVQSPEPFEKRIEWFEAILSRCQSRPMWSMIFAAINLDLLARHMSRFMVATCEDAIKWPVRWGDARVLPHLLNLLPRDKIADLLAPLYSWIVPSRSGELLRWSGMGNGITQTLAYDSLPIDDKTFGTLVDVSEPDSIIARIDDTDPDLLRKLKPSEYHGLIKRQLEMADKYDIHSPGARQHFAMLATYLHEDCLKNETMKTLLSRVKNGADYFSEIKELPAKFWNEHERSS